MNSVAVDRPRRLARPSFRLLTLAVDPLFDGVEQLLDARHCQNRARSLSPSQRRRAAALVGIASATFRFGHELRLVR